MTPTPRHAVLAIEGASIGGGQSHVLLLAAGLQTQGWRLTVFASGQGMFTDRLRSLNVPVEILPMPKKPSWKIKKMWEAALAKHRPDVLHLHGGVAGFWGRWAESPSSTRRVYTIHGIHYVHHKNSLMKWISLAMERWVRSDRDVVICVCESDAKKAVRWGLARPEQIRVVSNGIDLTTPLPSPMPKSAMGVSENDFVLGMAGRLTRMKGHRYAIEALAKLRRNGRPVHLAVVGEGEDRLSLERLMDQFQMTPAVHWLGFQADPLPFLGGIDVHLMPSLWEGQPLVLMEAMRAGRPTIASKVDGIPEVAREGQEALLVPAGDSEAIAAAVERLFTDRDLARRLGENARSRALLYDERETARKVERIYNIVALTQ